MIIELTKENRRQYISPEIEYGMTRYVDEFVKPEIHNCPVGMVLKGGVYIRDCIKFASFSRSVWVEYSFKKIDDMSVNGGIIFAILTDEEMPDAILDRVNHYRELARMPEARDVKIFW